MLSLPLMRDPGGGVPRPWLHPARAIAGARGILVSAGLLAACGGNPTFPPPPNDSCFGSFIGLTLSADTIAVGDSVHVLARPISSFASCFPGVAFVVTYEPRPDSAVSILVTSDTTAWVRGVRPATVDLRARVAPTGATGWMPLVVVP